MALMSVRAYGRHRGVSHVAVLKAISSGRITRDAEGKVDSDLADLQWAGSTDVTKPLNSVIGNPRLGRDPIPDAQSMLLDSQLALDLGLPEKLPEPRSPIDGNGKSNGVDAAHYAAARALRETFLAKSAQLEYERAMGNLLEAKAVRDAAFRAARTARDLLLGLPARLAPLLSATSDQIAAEEILDKAVREICENIVRAVEASPSQKPKGRPR